MVEFHLKTQSQLSSSEGSLDRVGSLSRRQLMKAAAVGAAGVAAGLGITREALADPVVVRQPPSRQDGCLWLMEMMEEAQYGFQVRAAAFSA